MMNAVGGLLNWHGVHVLMRHERKKEERSKQGQTYMSDPLRNVILQNVYMAHLAVKFVMGSKFSACMAHCAIHCV